MSICVICGRPGAYRPTKRHRHRLRHKLVQINDRFECVFDPVEAEQIEKEQAAAREVEEERRRRRIAEEAAKAAEDERLRAEGLRIMRAGLGIAKKDAEAEIRRVRSELYHNGTGTEEGWIKSAAFGALPEVEIEIAGTYRRSPVCRRDELESAVALLRSSLVSNEAEVRAEYDRLAGLHAGGERDVATRLARSSRYQWSVPTTRIGESDSVRRAAKRLGFEPMDRTEHSVGRSSSRRDWFEYDWFILDVPVIKAEIQEMEREAAKRKETRGPRSKWERLLSGKDVLRKTPRPNPPRNWDHILGEEEKTV